MTIDEIKQAFGVLKLRERLIFKLAVLAGLRPGEMFGLRRSRLSENTADIQERIYRGKLDTPKTHKSIRVVALSASVREDLKSCAPRKVVLRRWPSSGSVVYIRGKAAPSIGSLRPNSTAPGSLPESRQTRSIPGRERRENRNLRQLRPNASEYCREHHYGRREGRYDMSPRRNNESTVRVLLSMGAKPLAVSGFRSTTNL